MESNGWIFGSNSAEAFAPGGSYCTDVPSTSYCGYDSSGDLTLSYIFTFSGTATLQYGQSWDGGSVHVNINDEEVDYRSTRGLSTTMFSFSLGDELKIEERSDSVINIHKLTLEKSGM